MDYCLAVALEPAAVGRLSVESHYVAAISSARGRPANHRHPARTVAPRGCKPLRARLVEPFERRVRPVRQSATVRCAQRIRRMCCRAAGAANSSPAVSTIPAVALGYSGLGALSPPGRAARSDLRRARQSRQVFRCERSSSNLSADLSPLTSAPSSGASLAHSIPLSTTRAVERVPVGPRLGSSSSS
jgi:hypothetical protein